MQLNLALTSNLIMALLVIAVGLSRVYTGYYNVEILTVDVRNSAKDQPNNDSGVRLVGRIDYVQLAQGVAIVLLGMMKLREE